MATEKKEKEKKVRQLTKKFSLRKKPKKEKDPKSVPITETSETEITRKLSTIFEETEDNTDTEQRNSKRSLLKVPATNKIEVSKVVTEEKSDIQVDAEEILVRDEQKSTSEEFVTIEENDPKARQSRNDSVEVSEDGTDDESGSKDVTEETEGELSEVNGELEINEECLVTQEYIEDFIDTTGPVTSDETYEDEISEYYQKTSLLIQLKSKLL